MGLPLNKIDYYDLGGGLNLKDSPIKTPADECTAMLNMDFSPDGATLTRNGSRIMNISGGIPAQMSGAPRTLLLYDYRKSDGTAVQIICAGTTIKQSLTTPTNMVTGLSASLPIPDIEFMVTNDDEYAFWGNGVDTNLKFNGTTWTNWSIARPASTMTAADNGVGTLGAGDYTYYVAFARTVGGVIVQESELNATPATVTIAANRQILLSNIPVSTDPQVNARVIYRQLGTGAIHRVTVGATIADNVTTTYADNTATISAFAEASFDRQAVPTSAVFEEYMGRMFIVDAAQKTDVYYTPVNQPWYAPTENFFIFDGPVKCIKRLYGALIFGTDRSIWVLNGDPETNSPRRISSVIGILNNRCMVGETAAYILATNKKFYVFNPTDFSQSEIRTDAPASIKIDPLFNQIAASASESVCMEYYTTPNVAKIMIGVPISSGAGQNDGIIIYNETQSILKQKPVWQVWDNINASALRQFVVNGVINLYSGDYNGFLWKLDDPTIFGDGAVVNGTATSGAASTLTDSTQTWTVNAYIGMRVRVIVGTGINQVRTVTANTATTLTVTPAWNVTPDSTSHYTIGGYDVYWYSNWKEVVESYEALKQLWYIWVNANSSGAYTITMILQKDFDQDTNNQLEIDVDLTANNSIWGAFYWGQAFWGARAVFTERFRKFLRFRAIRVAFKHREAGQPFQVNGFALNVQNKSLFARQAA